ncbi:MAG: nitroreductase family deazaflavin-dependent oxidoreductase [Chloroflexota bacterium]|nr:nitroreductase family deazaflavin-dependent oxidoreductase [Chloroflexota bacterium]
MANDYNTAIIEEFRANNGKLGGRWENSKLVLVNTIDARSGQVRTVPPRSSRLRFLSIEATMDSRPLPREWLVKQRRPSNRRTLSGAADQAHGTANLS